MAYGILGPWPGIKPRPWKLWKLWVLTTGSPGIPITLYCFTHIAHYFGPFSSKWLRDYNYDHHHKSPSYPKKLKQNAMNQIK